jgi:hypothetical protein
MLTEFPWIFFIHLLLMDKNGCGPCLIDSGASGRLLETLYEFINLIHRRINMPAVSLKKVEELPEDIQKIIKMHDAWVGDTVFARVLAHVPGPFRAFDTFYGSLLGGKVDPEIKELARLKLAQLNNCHY